MIKNPLNDNDFGKRDKRGHWSPFKKLTVNPVYLYPFHPFKFIFNLIMNKFKSIWDYIFYITVIVSWLFLTPSFDTMKNFEISWISFILFRNLIFIILLCGFFFFFFYTFKMQGNAFKYNPKPLAKNNSNFFLNNQLIDNLKYPLSDCEQQITNSFQQQLIEYQEPKTLPDNYGNYGYLVYNNFDSLLNWNRSNYFAIAVGKLSDSINEN